MKGERGDIGEKDELDEEEHVAVGDGGSGGGVLLGNTEWGERTFELAQKVVKESGSCLSLFAFKASPAGAVRIRLDKLSDKYGSPTMQDIERFSELYITALETCRESGSLQQDVDVEVPNDITNIAMLALFSIAIEPSHETLRMIFTKLVDFTYLDPPLHFSVWHALSWSLGRSAIPSTISVSSPGAERVLRVPEDLERFKELPMFVKYEELGGDVGIPQNFTQQEAVLELESVDMHAGITVWKIANVKLNRGGKGKTLNNKQKKWREKVSFPALKQAISTMEVLSRYFQWPGVSKSVFLDCDGETVQMDENLQFYLLQAHVGPFTREKKEWTKKEQETPSGDQRHPTN